MTNFASISDAFDALRAGRFVILVDDEDRENEGDLIVAAQHVNEEQMATLIRHTSGIVFLAVSNEIADRLDLPPMVDRNTSRRQTPFTVSIEAAEGVDTGVSARDRVTTVRTAMNPLARPSDLHRPGHVFPLRAQDGGVLVRAGHTEGSVDLCRLAGLQPGAVGAELMNDDGTMMRLPEIRAFAEKHDVPVVAMADLIAWRCRHESLVRMEAESDLETDLGMWKMRVYRDGVSNREHAALIRGKISATTPTLVRVHSECLTGDVFHSRHCDCGEQLRLAMEKIAAEGSGILVYLRQEGRGIGLANKIRAYDLQQRENLDTAEANVRLGFPADLRTYGIGAQILKDIGAGQLRLLTNNPKKIVGLEGYGLHVVDQLPISVTPVSERQKKYLKTKKEKMGHMIDEM
jgi:3,4-dihydroxy 2-butanone 4-phosphate synthase/GTP cyclohydrolase II